MKKFAFVILLLIPLIGFSQAEKRYRSIIVDSLKGLNGGRVDVKDTLLLDSLAVYNTDLSSQYTSRSLVDSAFVGTAISSVGGNTIYTADDALSSDRIVTTGVNDLTFASAGESNLLEIDGDNDRIGIGISTPLYRLQIETTTNDVIPAFAIRTSGNNSVELWNGVTTGGAILTRKAAGTISMSLGLGSLDFINTGNNLGIGLSSSIGAKLTVAGINATSTSDVLFLTDNTGVTPLLIVENAGDIGIGHSNPEDPLDIQFLSGEALTLRVDASGVGTNLGIDWKFKNSGGSFFLYNNISARILNGTSGSETSRIKFFTSDNGALIERMRLYEDGTLSLGNVAFNTTLLNVNKAVDGDLFGMEIVNSQINAAASLNETVSFHFSFGAFGDAPGAGIIRVGKIGDFTSAANEDGFMAFHTATDGAITEKVRIDDKGNVGIGTTTPATSAILELSTTTGALLVSRMNTAARDALTAVNGMIIYNSQTNAFNFYENGSWVTK